jgi:tRNA 2-selenouridine synthase
MPVQKITIEAFHDMRAKYPLLDARSPSEYAHAHIPGAYSLPLFTDDERKVIGTAYKQQGKQPAIKIGLDYFGPKMRTMVEKAELIISSGPLKEGEEATTVIVHCWRGGMRSAAVAWLLDLYGYNVYTLIGGYKAYRNWAVLQFEKDYNMKILGGYTGSGKTNLLQQLQSQGETVIDLEQLASHKGSAFGGIGQPPQPNQEMFENLLAEELFKKENKECWLEDESQRIGKLHIPHPFWNRMRTKPVFFVDIPFEERLQFILQDYGDCNHDMMKIATERIQKRLGPLETKMALASLDADDLPAFFSILLKYYDKHYGKGLYNRENVESLLNKIPCSTVDKGINAQKLLECSATLV